MVTTAAQRRVEWRFPSRIGALRFAVARFLYGGRIGEGAGPDGPGRGARWTHAESALRRSLVPLSFAFDRVGAVSAALAHGARVQLDRPVLSVGNLGLGGTGKTPFVRWIARRLHESGR
jgi:hypothetical protein